MTKLLVGAGLAFLAYAAIFAPLERAFPARPQPVLRRAWLTDLAFFLGQQLAWSGLVLGALAWTEASLLGPAPDRWIIFVSSLPWLLQAAAIVLVGDVAVYWTHRAFHRVPVLWRFHRVHHTSESLDWLAAFREHPVDGLCTALAVNLPAFLLGFPIATIAPLVVFRGLWALFIHSNVRLPLGPLRVLFGAPDLHHWHHARVETRHNFANLAPWTDLLFGTYHRPAADESYALGVPEPAPGSYLGLLASAFTSRPGLHPSSRNRSAAGPLPPCRGSGTCRTRPAG